MNKARVRILVTLLLILGLVVAFCYLPKETIEKYRSAFLQFSPWLLVLVAAASVLQVIFMCLRFWFLFPSPRPSIMAVTRAIANGHLVNAFAPARAGEAVKILQLNQGTLKIPIGEVSATFAIDKLVDFAAILFLISIFRPSTFSDNAGSGQEFPWLILVCFIAGIVVLAWFLRGWLVRLKPHWDKFKKNLKSLKDWKKVGPSFLVGVGAWSAELVALRLLGQAQGVTLSWQELMAVIVALNLAISVGASVANLGTFEAPIVYVLTHFGLTSETALAIAVTHHALQWAAVGLVVTVLGAMSRKSSSSKTS